MANIDLSPDEIKHILVILTQVSYKLPDAEVILPLVRKLEGHLPIPPITPDQLNGS